MHLFGEFLIASVFVLFFFLFIRLPRPSPPLNKPLLGMQHTQHKAAIKTFGPKAATKLKATKQKQKIKKKKLTKIARNKTE